MKIIKRWEGVQIRKKKLEVGDVYSIIDDGVMVAQLQNDISLIKDYPYTLPTPVYPHNTKEEKAINDE